MTSKEWEELTAEQRETTVKEAVIDCPHRIKIWADDTHNRCAIINEKGAGLGVVFPKRMCILCQLDGKTPEESPALKKYILHYLKNHIGAMKNPGGAHRLSKVTPEQLLKNLASMEPDKQKMRIAAAWTLVHKDTEGVSLINEETYNKIWEDLQLEGATVNEENEIVKLAQSPQIP